MIKRIEEENICLVKELRQHLQLLDVSGNRLARYDDLEGLYPLVGRVVIDCMGNPLPSFSEIQDDSKLLRIPNVGNCQFNGELGVHLIGEFKISEAELKKFIRTFSSSEAFSEMKALYPKLDEATLINYILLRFYPKFGIGGGKRNSKFFQELSKFDNLFSTKQGDSERFTKANSSFENLENVSLSVQDGYRSIPRDLLKIEGLKRLTFSGFYYVPLWVGELDVVTLNISGSKEVEIPRQLKGLKNLEILRFTDSKLLRLPPWLLELEGLKILDVSGNNLLSMRSNVEILRKLKERGCEFNISNNPFIEKKFINSPDRVYLD